MKEKEEIHELTVDEIKQMTVEQMQQKMEQNKKQIKKTNILNPIFSAGFIGLGIMTAFLAPGIGQWGFPVIAGAALAMSNGWAVEVNVKLKSENKKLANQIEIETLKQKIALKEKQLEISKNKTQDTHNKVSQQIQIENPHTTQQTQLDDGLSM